jgi:hypothetical protein
LDVGSLAAAANTPSIACGFSLNSPAASEVVLLFLLIAICRNMNEIDIGKPRSKSKKPNSISP